VLRVPPPAPRPAFLTHPRLRRTSGITQFAVAAAIEALGNPEPGSRRDLGVILCVFSGCVNYSRRFYDETLKDPATASPLVFPETVFNAPASHLSAWLGSTAINYTLVGDSGTILIALAVAGRWLLEGKVRECLVVGSEEIDWLSSDALRIFDRSRFLSEGAGALLVSAEPREHSVRLERITDEFLYAHSGKMGALQAMRAELEPQTENALLCDSTVPFGTLSREETALWSGWPNTRISPKAVLGEGLMAAACWQLVAAADALVHSENSRAYISISGFHQHAIGAALSRA
jgi:hypothetical protein